MNNNQLYSLSEVVDHARTYSPYYRHVYRDVPQSGWNLEGLPVIDSADFWNNKQTNGENTVLTTATREGIVFKSGGTTGAPKHSVFSRNEWATMCHALGVHLQQAGLEDGDRAANLFYGGSLYASFLFVYHALMDTPARIMQYPLSGAADQELTIETIREFDINVLLGLPTTLLPLFEGLKEKGRDSIHIDRIFYAGETMYSDQRSRVEELFPGIRIASCGLASVDAGFLAYADADCGFNEHRVNREHTILEIIDAETGKLITEEGREGLIVATNLTRKVMPIIRYPIGDYGMWREPQSADNRKFVLLGRSEAGARVGPATVYVSDVTRILDSFSRQMTISNYQLIVSHEQELDRLTIRLCATCQAADRKLLQLQIIEKLLEERQMLAQLIDEQLIHPVGVQWVHESEIEVNRRTGKTMRVIDRRLQHDLSTHS